MANSRVIGVLLFVGIAYIMYPLVVGGGKMQTFCDTIQIGESTDKVLSRALERGYTDRVMGQGSLLIIDSSAMGRYICDVSTTDGKIVKVTYVYND